ncbi:MAG TPA: ABC transporter permease [Candidatus Eisenbacteria bacterium]|jgi:ABC-2 type transport system permease protein|nr:ABC transporter permease [Candidatus Eisenbacteria bacterium]
MRAYWTLVRRELGGHFVSWTGYVVMAVVLFLLGLCFLNLLQALNGQPSDRPVTELFFSTVYFWLILQLASPVITMRSFAQEKSSGTFETLMTAPVSDHQVVLAKFSGALLFYCLSWLPLLGCLFIVHHFSRDQMVLDPATLGSTFLGIFLLGALYMALGCFASAISRSQSIAAMVSFALGLSLFLLSFLAYTFAGQTGWQSQLFTHLGLIEHLKDFARGVVDTRPIVLYLSLTVYFLFLTLKVIESRRWK